MIFFSICNKIMLKMFTESYSRHLKVLKKVKKKKKKNVFQNLSDFWCTTTLSRPLAVRSDACHLARSLYFSKAASTLACKLNYLALHVFLK